MSFEGIDEWDENFLDEAIRIELEALASRNLTSNPPELRTAPPDSSADLSSSRQQPDTIFPGSEPATTRIGLDSYTDPEPFVPVSCLRPGARVSTINGGAGADSLSFSPPRELSQRYVEKPNTEVDCEIIQPPVLRHDWCGNRRGGGGTERDREVDRLKRELGRASKQLKQLERECTELKKERAKKDEQLKCAYSEIEAKESEIHNLIRGNINHSRLNCHNTGPSNDQVYQHHVNEDKCAWQTSEALEVGTIHSKAKGESGPLASLSSDLHMSEHIDPNEGHALNNTSLTTCAGVHVQECHISKNAAMSKEGKTVGTQTIEYKDCGHTSRKDSTEDHISSKLLTFWDSPNSIMTAKNMISRLLVSCTADFCVLFRCMSMTSNTDLDCHADENLSHVTSHHDGNSIVSIDASKVSRDSRLYAILTKMHNGMAQLHELLETLLDICTLENVFVVHRSLRILHTILQHLLSYNKRTIKRKNVLVGQPLNDMNEDPSLQDWNQIMDNHHRSTSNENENSGSVTADARYFDLENLYLDQEKIHNIKFLSSEKLVSIFKSMQFIVLRNTKECVRVEALRVMILIMMESNPNTERNKFGLITLLEVVPRLLQKEAGLHVKKHALQLLFLLLNCPKMLMLFSNGSKDSPYLTETVDSNNVALIEAVTLILEGLSECLLSTGTGNLEVKLRKQSIILLAYVASCGKSGFDVLKLVTHHGLNFLQLIVQILASEMDVENNAYAKGQALCNERTSLLREALILLNRLASNPAYSNDTLKALTSSNSIRSLTVDVVSRLPHRSGMLCKNDDAKKTQMEAETMDLARLFRARVFAYLGGKQIS
ncbi:hypothetical protein Cni_G03665 [Canna indica]|uniref:ATR interacting protein n=1 Tax=Canna indica TaxID=4628 RepID=A0AAQ3Q395_9LILI|nr:hypothetical protein Cni_G03665 [Canna indica]